MTLRELLSSLRSLGEDYLDTEVRVYLSIERAPAGEWWVFSPLVRQVSATKIDTVFGELRSIAIEAEHSFDISTRCCKTRDE